MQTIMIVDTLYESVVIIWYDKNIKTGQECQEKLFLDLISVTLLHGE